MKLNEFVEQCKEKENAWKFLESLGFKVNKLKNSFTGKGMIGWYDISNWRNLAKAYAKLEKGKK